MKDFDAKSSVVADGFIGEIPLFKGLPAEQLKQLTSISVNFVFRKGDTIFSEGDDASGFYVLKTGRIKIFKLSFEGKEQILHIIFPGEPFGEVPVFSGETFPAHAEALEESGVIFFSKKAFIELIKKDPSIAMNMLAILSRRLKQFISLVENLSLKEVPQRLASYFLSVSNGNENVNSFELDVSKGQLANILGTIPETLSRILSKLVNQGLIRVQGRTIKSIDNKGLEDIANGG